MNIVIGSAFRNATHYLDRYFAQVEKLQAHAGSAHTIRVVAVEGDSNDATNAVLHSKPYIQVVERNHGKKWFGSTEEPERLITMSKIGNAIFEHVRDTDDVLVYVESDLIWDAHTIGSLVDCAMRRDYGYDVFAPLIFAGPHFYDIWGFRINGERFVPFVPYHIAIESQFTELDSAGSCLVMRAEVARKCRIRNDYCLVGWCEDARSQGYKIALNSFFKVDHPA